VSDVAAELWDATEAAAEAQVAAAAEAAAEAQAAEAAGRAPAAVPGDTERGAAGAGQPAGAGPEALGGTSAAAPRQEQQREGVQGGLPGGLPVLRAAPAPELAREDGAAADPAALAKAAGTLGAQRAGAPEAGGGAGPDAAAPAAAGAAAGAEDGGAASPAAQPAAAPIVVELRLVTGAAGLPHPDKADRGGEVRAAGSLRAAAPHCCARERMQRSVQAPSIAR